MRTKELGNSKIGDYKEVAGDKEIKLQQVFDTALDLDSLHNNGIGRQINRQIHSYINNIFQFIV